MARKRSESAHKKVLTAALELVAQRGVDTTSMDAIAEASGVSKATIYKHWADKDALLLELVAEVHGLQKRPAFDSGHTRVDLASVLGYRPPEHADIRERLLPHFMAYSVRNPSFGLAWRDLVMEPPRRELTQLLKSGIKKGELPADLNLEFALTILLGPVIYWKMFKRTPEDPERLAERVVDVFWTSFGRRSRRSSQAH